MSVDIFDLSQEQKEAVDITKNISVSAGAGSGKTRVLTNRYINYLDEGYEIEDIAAITFTEKAALEMKERIRKAISLKTSLTNASEKLKWMKHMDKLNTANISTIHGFCSNIIKENAAYLGIDFNFSIINEIDRNIILNEAAERTISSYIESEIYGETIKKLREVYGDEYLSTAFINELLNIRTAILEEGRNILNLLAENKSSKLEELAFKIIDEVDKEYLDYKLENDILDYNDLQSMALSVLEEDDLRYRYRKRYKALLVDEFQDTNEIQRKIIYKLCTNDDETLIEGKLFIVGDFKQSIYGFRGTDYRIFKDVTEDIGTSGQKSLSTCYRSKNEIISGVNSIFNELIEDYEPLKQPDDKSIEEKRIIVAVYHKEDKKKENSILVEVKNMLKGKESKFKTLEDALKALKESYENYSIPENKDGISVVRGIKILIDKGLNFKDICVLLRNRNVLPQIEEELKKRNIPYCIIGGVGFYQREEVEDILNLYKVVVRGFGGEFINEDNKNFIKALRSPFLAVSDNSILKLKIQKDEVNCQNLYEAFSLIIEGTKDKAEGEKLTEVYRILERLESQRNRLSVVQILKSIIKECNVYEILLSRKDGLQRVRNIEKLLREGEKSDKEKLFTLEQFIEHIALLDANSMDDSDASLDTEDSQAVKIMTIHQSKGLEFGGVVVPKIEADLLRQSKVYLPSLAYYNGRIISSMDFENPDYENVEYTEYKTSKFIREIDEAVRLLYVAMTRAKDYIVLTGKDDEEVPTEIKTPEDKINQLNSFIKQIKYAIKVKGADDSCIGFVNIDLIQDIEVQNKLFDKISLDTNSIDKRLELSLSPKVSTNVSASKYMKHQNCPRRYYIDNLLKVNASDYLEEYGEEIGIDHSPQQISAATLGTVVHSVIEKINNNSKDIKDNIKNTLVEFGLDENIEDRVNRYIQGYQQLEKNKEDLGELSYSDNELEYNLTPNDDRKTMITGFIDRVEVFKKGDKLIAVVTDYKTNRITSKERLQELIKTYDLQLQLYGKAIMELLYLDGLRVDEIVLQLYFLDKPEKVLLKYDENRIQEKLAEMDKIFARNLSDYPAKNFEKVEKQKCDGCDYLELCF